MDKPTKQIKNSGTVIWWLGDSLHRHGEIHRTDGPAVIYPNGTKEWWYRGRKFTFEDWSHELRLTNDEIGIIKLKYG